MAIESSTGRILRTAAILVSACALYAGHATLVAQEQGPNTSEKIDAPAEGALATQQAHLASEVAAYGRESQNAMALIVAAEMLAQAGGKEVEREKQTEDPVIAAQVKDPGEENHTVAALLSDARALARGDENLLAAIDQLASQESKGRLHPRSTSHRDKVRGRHSDTYRIGFKGGEPAIVSVVGDGGTDLDLRIYDQNDNLICSDLGNTDRCYCRWQPRWTGSFRVQITNLGSVSNAYVIRTNY